VESDRPAYGRRVDGERPPPGSRSGVRVGQGRVRSRPCQPATAREICSFAWLGDRAAAHPDLTGVGLRRMPGLSRDLRRGWIMLRDGCPGREMATRIGRRLDRGRTIGGKYRSVRASACSARLGSVWIALPVEGRSALSAGPAHSATTARCPLLRIWSATAGEEPSMIRIGDEGFRSPNSISSVRL
jgi:hypothetical protein